MITPVLKKPSLSKEELKNYRPVSNTRYMGKLIETAVSNQLTAHVETNQLMDIHQSAYRAKHSTETALVFVHDFICRELDNQQAVFVITLDLSAAFDTVDHTLLLDVFQQRYGVSGSVLAWFESYLQHRRYHVRVHDSTSDESCLEQGVPQGSIIGPQCFNMYLQPVCDILQKYDVRYHIYADDIQIYCSFNPRVTQSINESLDKLHQCISDIQSWMLTNKLKLNRDKTEFMIAASPNHHKQLLNIQLKIDEQTTILPSSTVRVLGVTFDKCMSMSDHVSSVSKSVNFHVRNISRIRKYIDKDSCHAAVRSLVLSRLDYCNSLLNGISQKDLNSLQLLQNKAARLIYCKPKFDHVSHLITDLHWLSVNNRIAYKTLSLTFKCVNNLAPVYLADLLLAHTSKYNTRSTMSKALVIPRTRKRIGDRAFSVAAPTIWNSLPFELKNNQTFTSFKKNLKTYLF